MLQPWRHLRSNYSGKPTTIENRIPEINNPSKRRPIADAKVFVAFDARAYLLFRKILERMAKAITRMKVSQKSICGLI